MCCCALADCVERGEIDGGTEAGAEGRGDGAAPEGGDEVRCRADVRDCGS